MEDCFPKMSSTKFPIPHVLEKSRTFSGKLCISLIIILLKRDVKKGFTEEKLWKEFPFFLVSGNMWKSGTTLRLSFILKRFI